jgi:DNA-binding transcriptional MerR regulator
MRRSAEQPAPEPVRRFTLDVLCTVANVPRRTVRCYLQIKLLDRPVGETKGARYLSGHLDTLLRIRQLADAGVSLDRIRDHATGVDRPPRPLVDPHEKDMPMIGGIKPE